MKVTAICPGTIRNNNNTSYRARVMERHPIYTKYFLDDSESHSLCIRGEANNFFKGEKDYDARTLISNRKCGLNAVVTPKLEKYKNLRILLSRDSKIFSNEKAKNHFLVSIERETENTNQPAFGTLYGSIRQSKDGTSDTRMENEYKRFFTSGMKKLAETKYPLLFADRIRDSYNHYTPTDGDGTRFRPVSALQGGVTKPAAFLPATFNGQKLSFIQSVLTNFARTGTMDNNLEFIKVEPAKGSAYAFLEGLKNGTIPTDKPIVFSWGDNFTDVNIARLINKHEKSNSGFTMMVLPKGREEVKALGVIEVENNDKPLREKKIKMFVEKPTEETLIDRLVVDELKQKDGEEKVLAVVGPYVISREALKWLKKEYTRHPEDFQNDKGYDFSSTVITGLLRAMQNGEITDRNTHKPLSMYFDIKKNSESWSDVGSRVDLVKAVDSVAHGGFQNLPMEIRSSMARNLDQNNNIYIDKKAKLLAKEMARELNITFDNCIITTAD